MPYVRCPACGEKNYISTDLSDAVRRGSTYYKWDTCSLCGHRYFKSLPELKEKEEIARAERGHVSGCVCV